MMCAKGFTALIITNYTLTLLENVSRFVATPILKAHGRSQVTAPTVKITMLATWVNSCRRNLLCICHYSLRQLINGQMNSC